VVALPVTANSDSLGTIVGSGLFNVDYSMVKDNEFPRVSDAFDVKFHAELLNVFSHLNLASPAGNLDDLEATGAAVPGFGQIASTQNSTQEV
jgi:hypothetical protein